MKILTLAFLLVIPNIFPQVHGGPWSFFPAHIGDMWQYEEYNYLHIDTSRIQLVSDSIVGKFRTLYCVRDTFSVYTDNYIDSSAYSVFGYHTDWYPNLKKFKVDAEQGEAWIFRSYFNSLDTLYEMAYCRAKYQMIIYGPLRDVMEITYFRSQPDTIVTENSWPIHTVYIASGIGEFYDFDEDGVGPLHLLIACRINGDTIGVLTNTEKESILKRSYQLFQNYPNPFNPSTTIQYKIKYPGNVSIKVYDVLGRELATLVNEYKNIGTYKSVFNAGSFASGIYIYELKTGSSILRKKMNLIK